MKNIDIFLLFIIYKCIEMSRDLKKSVLNFAVCRLCRGTASLFSGCTANESMFFRTR